MTHATAFPTSSHSIKGPPVIFSNGPDDGEHLDITRIDVLDGKRVVMSRHSEGFYWLPPQSARDYESGFLIAVWEPHRDARFSCIRER